MFNTEKSFYFVQIILERAIAYCACNHSRNSLTRCRPQSQLVAYAATKAVSLCDVNHLTMEIVLLSFVLGRV